MDDTVDTVLAEGDADRLSVPERQVIAVLTQRGDGADRTAVVQFGNDLLKGSEVLIDIVDQLLKGGQFLVGLVQFILNHARAGGEESQ